MAKQQNNKTSVFLWAGINAQGQPTQGELEASNTQRARAALRQQGVRVKRLRKKSKPLIPKRIKPKDISIATRQLATMLSAGIPIASSYAAIAKGSDHEKIQEVFKEIQTEVEAGTNLSLALNRYPRLFDDLYTNLVAVGERSGNLDNLMEKIASYMENHEEIKAKIKGAMFYPAAVIAVAFIVTTLLLLFVIPRGKPARFDCCPYFDITWVQRSFSVDIWCDHWQYRLHSIYLPSFRQDATWC